MRVRDILPLHFGATIGYRLSRSMMRESGGLHSPPRDMTCTCSCISLLFRALPRSYSLLLPPMYQYVLRDKFGVAPQASLPGRQSLIQYPLADRHISPPSRSKYTLIYTHTLSSLFFSSLKLMHYPIPQHPTLNSPLASLQRQSRLEHHSPSLPPPCQSQLVHLASYKTLRHPPTKALHGAFNWWLHARLIAVSTVCLSSGFERRLWGSRG